MQNIIYLSPAFIPFLCKFDSGKMKGIIKLKERQAKINFKIGVINIIKKEEAFLLVFTEHKLHELSNAFANAPFLLIFIKIGYYCIFSYQIPFNLIFILRFFFIK